MSGIDRHQTCPDLEALCLSKLSGPFSLTQRKIPGKSLVAAACPALASLHMGARLRDSLSNPGKPLARLLKALERAGEPALPPVVPVSADPAATTDIRECRMLSPDEVAELVEAYTGMGSR
ncbi:hypothetical protein [Streptomyces sp. NPDC101237]|uniref:hypothetical protein n=1 Tax=Streptomyces sp. NPDC101237 TaxID=3366139 RepID=UPI003818A3BA